MTFRRCALLALLSASLWLAACGPGANPSPAPSLSPPPPGSPGVPAVTPSVTPEPPSPTPVAPEVTPSALPTPVRTQAPNPTPLPRAGCRVGGGLRQETGPILAANAAQPALVMSATTGLAELYFPQLEGWIRVLGAPSLAELERKADLAAQKGLEYEGLAYGLETGKSTPDAEWQDLVGSTQQARAIADKYSKLLVMGPGFQLMSNNEDKYPGMSALADIWVFQTQRLQLAEPGPEYRDAVKRVLDLIRSGNPKVQIWTQITLPPDREPNAQEWLEYRASIDDLVDGTYVGAYTWNRVDSALLVSTIESIFAGACGGD